MIETAKAIKIVLREAVAGPPERIPLEAASGRILREPIIADTDLPPFDRSQMDGYAVIAADTNSVPISLKIVAESAAGKGWNGTVKTGQAVRIMTGARVPKGATAVQKLELARESDGSVEILETAKSGLSIVRRGEEIRKGVTVFPAGMAVTDNMVASLASFGYSRVMAGRRPRIAILGTGSEIVDITRRPGRDQIRNSNSIMLAVLCRRIGAEAEIFPIVRDELADLKSQIRAALRRADILIATGGVSVGRYDHTKRALAELGAEILFEKVRLKPGKPTVFARLGKKLIFGLPGNPVSAAVTFHLFARPAIMQMQGATRPAARTGSAVLAASVRGAKERDTYLPSRLETDAGGSLVAIPLKWQGSSDFIGFASADSLIRMPRDTAKAKGDVAEIIFI